MKHHIATYPNATQAKEFAENAERVIGATGITRTGRTVEFDAPLTDGNGYSTHGDIALSVGYYGGPGTKLNGNRVPREM